MQRYLSDTLKLSFFYLFSNYPMASHFISYELPLYFEIFFFLISMQNPKGSYYSAFVWKFANSQENAFEDFVLEPIDVGYIVICSLFVSFGVFGMFLNGKNIYSFWWIKTVRQK